MTRDEVSKYSGISSGGSLTNILEELEQCGFITIYSDFSNIKRNKLYQLTDFYSLFYLSFIKGKRVTNADYWSTLLNSSKKNTWAGFSFELLCQVHVDNIKKALGISGVVSYISGWRSKSSDNGAQIDLIIDRDDNVINLCEIKFSKGEFTIDKAYDKVLRNKKQVFMEETRTKKAIHTTLVTTYGVNKNKYWNNIQNEVVLEELFG